MTTDEFEWEEQTWADRWGKMLSENQFLNKLLSEGEVIEDYEENAKKEAEKNPELQNTYIYRWWKSRYKVAAINGKNWQAKGYDANDKRPNWRWQYEKRQYVRNPDGTYGWTDAEDSYPDLPWREWRWRRGYSEDANPFISTYVTRIRPGRNRKDTVCINNICEFDMDDLYMECNYRDNKEGRKTYIACTAYIDREDFYENTGYKTHRMYGWY